MASACRTCCSTSRIPTPRSSRRLPEGREQAGDDQRREPERQLVGEQHLRFTTQRACERQHLLLAARQQAGGALHDRLERGKQLAGLLRGHVGEAQVVGRGEVHDHRALLGEVAEPGAAADVHRRGGRLAHPADFARHGLAAHRRARAASTSCPRRSAADQRDHLARRSPAGRDRGPPPVARTRRTARGTRCSVGAHGCTSPALRPRMTLLVLAPRLCRRGTPP